MKGAIYYVAIAKMIFSHVKISSFRAKAHLVFHWCLYNKSCFSCETKSGNFQTQVTSLSNSQSEHRIRFILLLSKQAILKIVSKGL